MKDFHDVYSLINSFREESSSKVEESIRQVFRHRETVVAFPIVYSGEDLVRLQTFWDGYIRGLAEKQRQKLPEKIDDVVSVINHWIQNYTNLFT